MANRVLIGDRATGGEGFYVSKSGDNVLTTTNSLQYDSRMAASLIVHSYGQAIQGVGTQTVTHNLGYKPLFAVRWGDAANLTAGKLTKVWSPVKAMDYFEGYYGDPYMGLEWGITTTIGTTSLAIENHTSTVGDISSVAMRDVYLAWVIFHQEDFTNGQGL